MTEEIAEGGLERLRAAGHDVDVRLGLAVGRERIGPARSEIPADVFHQHGDAVRVGVERREELQVVELCGEGVGRYDLGTEMDYKRRWAEDIMETEMLVLVR